MSILGIIDLVLSLLTGVLSTITTNGKIGSIEKVSSEIQAAIEALDRAHGHIVAIQELESLRTKPTW
jgi:hypothetical protein